MEYSSDDPENSLGSHESSPEDRPNRFVGSASTWRKLTEEVRLVSESLTQLRDQDLSIHLYNAHALQKRQYDAEVDKNLKLWASKERWRRIRSADGKEDGSTFAPPKSWTAWPLTAETVPRTGEQLGGGDQDAEAWTLKRRDGQWPSRELEEILMGITLRLAKERFEAREWDKLGTRSDQVVAKNGDDADMELDTSGDSETSMVDEVLRKRLPQSADQNTTRRSSAKSDMADDYSTMTHPKSRPRKSICDDEEGAKDGIPSQDASKVHPQNGFTKDTPVILADNERSSQLLCPTVRHVLARLDELLFALHETRKTCLYYGSELDESQTEAESRNRLPGHRKSTSPSPSLLPISPHIPPHQPLKRGPGRPRKVVPVSDTAGTTLAESTKRNKKANRGAKRRLEEESQKERIGRPEELERKSVPSSPLEPGDPGSRSRTAPARSRSRRGTSTHAREKRLAYLGLRDWSEVVGTAALVGFPADVVARATQRCANLFGEGMSLMSLPENDKIGNDEGIFTQYKPHLIPDMGDTENDGSDGSDDSKPNEENSHLARFPGPKVYQRQSLKSEPTSPMSLGKWDYRAADDRFLCPYSRCPRQSKGYGSRGHLSRHLKMAHDVAANDLKDRLGDNNDEIVGAVHVDGFLKEVRRRAGWRGRDEEKRVRKSGKACKSRGSDGDVSVGDEMGIESGMEGTEPQ